MSCLAQIPMRGHLDQAGPFAGRDSLLADEVLHIFTCERPSVCSFWDPHGGANAAFFLDVHKLDPSSPGIVVSSVPVLPGSLDPMLDSARLSCAGRIGSRLPGRILLLRSTREVTEPHAFMRPPR